MIVIIGKSGSGKTEIAKRLERLLGINRIKGYTTRPKRDESDDDYIFVTDEFVWMMWDDDVLCKTTINGYEYFKLKSEITGDNQTIIVNPEGLRELYETDIEMVVINLVADYEVRFRRITTNLLDTTIRDKFIGNQDNWNSVTLKAKDRLSRDAGFECLKVDWTVDANRTIEEVYEDVKKIIEMQ